MPDAARDTQATFMHGSTVAYDDRALLILGKSGSGKSTLALQLIALGAQLVADDRTMLTRHGDAVHTAPGPNLAGLIEARHIGILSLPHCTDMPLSLVVDMDQLETERLPRLRHITLLGHEIPLYRCVDSPHFAPSLFLCLSGNRTVP